MANAGKTYIWVVAAILIAVILISAFLYLTSPKINPTLAVINKTTGKVLWIGNGALCIPSINGSYLTGCSRIRGSVYSCNGIVVNESNVTNMGC